MPGFTHKDIILGDASFRTVEQAMSLQQFQ